jgi:hypothetical protein
VLDADGNYAPVRSVKLGQDIKLRLIYDTGHLETGNLVVSTGGFVYVRVLCLIRIHPLFQGLRIRTSDMSPIMSQNSI